jgi:hypothetical protein
VDRTFSEDVPIEGGSGGSTALEPVKVDGSAGGTAGSTSGAGGSTTMVEGGPPQNDAAAIEDASEGGAALEGGTYTVTTFSMRASCSSPVSVTADGFEFPDVPCFYVAAPAPRGTNYELSLEARLMNGDGYGIWMRGSYQEITSDKGGIQTVVTGFGGQYQRNLDPAQNGIKFVEYPQTERAYQMVNYVTDYAWHRWRWVGSGGTVTVYLDGQSVLAADVAASGVEFGFRTWRGGFGVRDLRVSGL